MECLLVDDDPSILKWLDVTLRPLGLEPVMAANGVEALEVLARRDIGFAIVDIMMPSMDGVELVRRIREQHLVIPVVVMSGVGSVDDAVNVLRLGADDFLSKPIKREVLLQRIEGIIEKARIYEEARMFRRYVEGQAPPEGIITRSPAMLRVLSRLPQIARTDASVLVQGPSGSGKELIARALHALSKRKDKPFVAVNCGAIPENLVESMLFGHRKGSFTGADRDSTGLARGAEGGTLFLDEVGDLPLAAQVKLLRFLQSHEVVPVGETKPVQVDVRIIGATHRNLHKLVGEGKFREDLYYRLNVIAIEVPALSERPEDLPVLASHFMKKHAADYSSPAKAFSPEALAALLTHPWTGNVRELENVVQRALVACDGPLVSRAHLGLAAAPQSMIPEAPRPAALPAKSSTGQEGTPMSALHAANDVVVRPFQESKKDAVDNFEREYLENLLRKTSRMTDAAELAGIDRKGLWRLLKKHGLNKNDEE